MNEFNFAKPALYEKYVCTNGELLDDKHTHTRNVRSADDRSGDGILRDRGTVNGRYQQC